MTLFHRDGGEAIEFLYDNFISDFLVIVIQWIVQFINEYSIAIILATLLVRVIVLPLDLKSKRSMEADGSARAGSGKPEKSAMRIIPSSSTRKCRRSIKSAGFPPWRVVSPCSLRCRF